MKPTRLVIIIALALVIAACGGAGSGSEIASGDEVTVKMFDNRFEFKEVHIPVGGSVTWLGAGRNPHNASDGGGTWSTEAVFGSLDQLEGDAATVTYDQPGTYTFFCTYHGNSEGQGMAGVLVVGGAE